ncbi:MAG TPA: response regulator [Gemmatimonadales bacterium]|nr:response regulator [Gemmatimonadales bacterium]
MSSLPPRPSAFTQGGDPAQVAEHEQRLAGDVQRAAIGQLLAGGPFSESLHLVLALLVAALIWDSLPVERTTGWIAGVAAAAGLRTWWRLRARRRRLSDQEALTGVRLTVVAIGLAWGIGAAVAIPELPLHDAALILVVLAGIVAAATSTLVGDRRSFQYLLLTVLAPIPLGIILIPGHDRSQYIAVALVALFAWGMNRIHARAYRTFAERVRATTLLQGSSAELARQHAYLDGLLASAPVAISVVDSAGQVLGINPHFERLYGFTGQDAVGHDINTLIVPKSELPKASQLDRRIRSGDTVVAEVERRRKDGTLVPVRMSARRVEGSAEGHVFVMYEDISDRRRAQDALTQLASIVETSEDAIIGQTLDGNVVSWNAAAQRLFGYTLGEIQGKHVTILAAPDRAGEVQAILERIRRGDHIEHFETARVRKDGTSVPVSISISVTRDSTGRISGFSTIARDVREEVATREALRQARDAAERLAQTRSAFLANMSHEIRTPLNAVLGLTELLLDTELAPEQRHSLTLVQVAGETLLTLLNDILDLSKIEAEQVRLESIPFGPAHLVETTIGLLTARARQKRIEVLADVAADVPAMVHGDPTRLRQVLTNLVGNAIKFTEAGEIVVSVHSSGPRDGRTIVRFAVRDTGIGIPADKLETIFEEFGQADETTTRKYGGTGLGLAIARRLVRLMDGDLTVTSAVGKGTEFAFSLPLLVEAGALAPAARPGDTHLAGRRVLVVDDSATNRRIVRGMLGAAGLQVGEAEDGDVGLAALRRAQEDGTAYDLAILDAQMPGLDGFALAAAVRAAPAIAGTRLLMLTSSGARGDGQRCRDLGINGYLTKPASRTDLLDAVTVVLGMEAGGAASMVVTQHSIAESRRRLQILLAEDNVVNQEVAATMLRKRGHDVDVVGDGRAAVEAAARKRYDAVLMDIQMPEMDGFEATRQIRSTPAGRDLRIIALTAHALGGEREKCLAQGMSDYLTKPFKAHELFALVEGRLEAGGAVPPAPAPSHDAPVDLDAFRREMREAGVEEAVDAILDTFVQSAAERISALSAALASGDAQGIKRAAHAFKSSAGTIGAKRLAALLQQVEALAEEGDVAQARALAERFAKESAAVTAYVRRARQSTG